MRRIVGILIAVVLSFSPSSVMAVLVEFKDGEVHDIDYKINQEVWVDYQSPGMGTVVNILDGANITWPHPVTGFEDSRINILGGYMDKPVRAYDRSLITVSGGLIDDSVFAYDNSRITVSGGSIEDYLVALGSSQVTVSGGDILAILVKNSARMYFSGDIKLSYLRANDNGQITVSGGSSGALMARDNSQITVLGGSVGGIDTRHSGRINISGGSFKTEWWLYHDSVITINGSDFAVDGEPVGYTELHTVLGRDIGSEPPRELTGTLLSGEPLNNVFRIGDSASIVLIPEPTTLLLVGLGGVMLYKGRHRFVFE